MSIITSNDFRRLCPFAFLLPTSKEKYQCFLFLVQSFSACTFSRIYALIVSDTNFHQVIHFPFKRPRTFFGALSHEICADWLVCIAYCIFWHLTGSDQLSFFFLNWTVCLFERKALSETIQINP